MDRIKLLPHNEESYEKLKEHFKANNVGAVIQPTGTGKSYIMAKLIEDNADKSFLILSPSIHINIQIQSLLNGLRNIEFMTYQGLLLKDPEYDFYDYIILDEFHRCGADKWGEKVERLVRKIDKTKLLGTSATPIRYLDNFRDMSDELFDGNVIVNLSLIEAIVKGVLPTPKYISSYYLIDDEIQLMKKKIDDSKNEDKSELYRKLDILKRNLDKSKGVPNILKKHVFPGEEKYKFIVFFSNKEHMENMRYNIIGWLKEAFGNHVVDLFEVYSEKNGNEKTLRNFEKSNAQISLLFSIDMLNEGVHLKDVSGVILLRPTKSPIVFYQQIGRAMSSGMSKSPIIFDLVNNMKSIGARQIFEDVDMVSFNYPEYKDKANEIKKFFIFDEMIDAFEELKTLESSLLNDWDVMFYKYKEQFRNSEDYLLKYIKGEVSSDINEWATIQRKGVRNKTLSKEKNEKLIEIDFVFSLSKRLWETYYNILKSVLKESEIKSISFSYTCDGIALGIWVNAQRTLFKKGLLGEEKVEKLNDLGFIWDHRFNAWEEQYSALKKVVCKYGSFLKAVEKISTDSSLYHWIVRTRQEYKNGILDLEKVNMLNEIGFSLDPNMDKWLKKYEDLKSGVDDEKMVQWCTFQRRKYKEGKLNEEKIRLLKDIGFNFQTTVSENELIELCKEHFEKYGSFTLKDNDYIQIKHFLSKQKKKYREGTLNKEIYKELIEIGFKVDGDQNETKWYENYKLFELYIKENGLSSLKKSVTYRTFKLGSWAIRQRTQYKRGMLKKWQVELMEEKGFSFK